MAQESPKFRDQHGGSVERPHLKIKDKLFSGLGTWLNSGSGVVRD